MSKIWTRGGVRVAFEKGALVVYIDADKLADVDEIDVPEVELVRVSKEDLARELGRFAKNVKDELGRLRKRVKK